MYMIYLYADKRCTSSMKNNRHGQAKIFENNEFQKLVAHTHKESHRLAFQISYYTAARMGEVVKLPMQSVYARDGKVLDYIIFWSEITKDDDTRSVPVSSILKSYLERYWLTFYASRPKDNPVDFDNKDFFLFPGNAGAGHIQFQSVFRAMQRALKRIGLKGRGYSCHSFRRTALTKMADQGISEKVMMSISGHDDPKNLHYYIDVKESQRFSAIATL